MPRRVLYDRLSAAATALASRLGPTFEVTMLDPTGASPPEAAVLLIDRHTPRSGAGGPVRIVALVDPSDAGPWPSDWYSIVSTDAAPALVARAIENAFRDLEGAADRAQLERELSELNAIGIRLSAERDPEALLHLILTKARAITESDAGSLYLVEGGRDQAARLRFALTQNDSVEVPFQSSTLPFGDESIAGHVALSGELVNIDDAYGPPPGSALHFDRSFDVRSGYRTRSMLVVPMRTPQGDTLGVFQLINCKPGFRGPLASRAEIDHHVRPFSRRHETLAASLASQAAVALHNSQLDENIRTLFEGFVKASVTAIESREPATSGHSFRVADLTVALAEAVNRQRRGPYATTHFTASEVVELRYASLLHDFGKVGVREEVLVKAKKLYPAELDRIRHRVELLKRDLELHALDGKLGYLRARGEPGYREHAARIDAELVAALTELDANLDLVVTANEPGILRHDVAQQIFRLAKRRFEDRSGASRTLLTPEEVRVLAIPKGTLTNEERKAIEQHVVHTFQFLAEIPWTREFRRIPEIARSHHERLDGSGYPYGLAADHIPVQSRMMAIADIYDALTAVDRPYKKAMPTANALDILRDERRAGTIDGDLLDLFIDAKVYALTPRH